MEGKGRLRRCDDHRIPRPHREKLAVRQGRQLLKGGRHHTAARKLQGHRDLPATLLGKATGGSIAGTHDDGGAKPGQNTFGSFGAVLFP